MDYLFAVKLSFIVLVALISAIFTFVQNRETEKIKDMGIAHRKSLPSNFKKLTDNN